MVIFTFDSSRSLCNNCFNPAVGITQRVLEAYVAGQAMSVKAMQIRRTSSPLHDRPHERRFDQVDPYLLIATLLLIAYGLVMTYAVTVESRTLTGDPMQYVIRGALWASIGLAVMVAVAMFDYAWLGTFAPVLYLITLGLLGVVLFIGVSSLGAQRSVNFAGMSFQFSEVAKVLMIVVLAKFFADRSDKIGSPITIGLGLAILGPAFVLVYRQPDLGTSLVFVAIFFGIAFMAGARIWQLVAMVADGRCGVPAHLGAAQAVPAGAPHRLHRPVRGSAGRGLEHHPVAHRRRVGRTDRARALPPGRSLRSAICRSPSPTSCSPDWRRTSASSARSSSSRSTSCCSWPRCAIAFRARDPFGMLLASGVVAMLVFQIMVNVGMAISLMPVTGIPLPFISHGGSSLVSICFALGVLAVRLDAARGTGVRLAQLRRQRRRRQRLRALGHGVVRDRADRRGDHLPRSDAVPRLSPRARIGAPPAAGRSADARPSR